MGGLEWTGGIAGVLGGDQWSPVKGEGYGGGRAGRAALSHCALSGGHRAHVGIEENCRTGSQHYTAVLEYHHNLILTSGLNV